MADKIQNNILKVAKCQKVFSLQDICHSKETFKRMQRRHVALPTFSPKQKSLEVILSEAKTKELKKYNKNVSENSTLFWNHTFTQD